METTGKKLESEDYLEDLIPEYARLMRDKNQGTIFEIFSRFYDLDLKPFEEWVDHKFSKTFAKDDSRSWQFLRRGNQYLEENDYRESIRCFTRGLCHAIAGSKEYRQALVKRAVALCKLGDLDSCTKDILLYKGLYKENGLTELDQEIEKLQEMIECRRNSSTQQDWFGSSYDLPEFPDGENPNFAFASTKIQLSYDKNKGRHVTAKSDIKIGDILFIEKPYVFTPVYSLNPITNETNTSSCSKEFDLLRCYHCLKDILSSVPCPSCTRCVYCDDTCRTENWRTFHRFECAGMRNDFWYDINMPLPALRILLKGVGSKVKNFASNFDEDLKKFGDAEDNYLYVHRLMSNIFKNKNLVPYLISSTVVIIYLRKYTDFFTWYLNRPDCPRKSQRDLEEYAGALITKHMAQVMCNGSTIDKWMWDFNAAATEGKLLQVPPSKKVTVASGLYPSVSIMNHSCRSNVNLYFILDTIVVKAVEDIPKGGEVTNCYGVDYRFSGEPMVRQTILKTTHHFQCRCVICSNPELELYHRFGDYLCSRCEGPVPPPFRPKFSKPLHLTCEDCQMTYNYATLKRLYEEAATLTKNLGYDRELLLPYIRESPANLERFLENLKVKQKLLHKQHMDLPHMYETLCQYYIEKGDIYEALKYFKLKTENVIYQKGPNSRQQGCQTYEMAAAIMGCLEGRHLREYAAPEIPYESKSVLKIANDLIKQSMSILPLYYPDELLNRLKYYRELK